MASRPDLQALFETLTPNVYFQPPASVSMSYPAIRYSLSEIENVHANNAVYTQFVGYEVIVIDADPDSKLVKQVSQLPRCSFDRQYAQDNLYHTVFTLYF